MLVDFCLPVKNEEKILRSSLDRLLAYCRQSNFSFSWRIVGVANGSDDTTVDILKEYAGNYPEEISWFEVGPAGRGGALKKYWSDSAADIFSYMDADLAVSLDNIPALINPLLEDKGDLSIGSRLMAGAKLRRSWGREIISQGYIFISHLLLHDSTSDYQCGFKALRRDTFYKIKPFLRDDYWFFDTELIVLAKRFDCRVAEIPIDWQEERYGRRSSTVKVFRDSLIFIKNLVFFRYRLKKIKKYPGIV